MTQRTLLLLTSALPALIFFQTRHPGWLVFSALALPLLTLWIFAHLSRLRRERWDIGRERVAVFVVDAVADFDSSCAKTRMSVLVEAVFRFWVGDTSQHTTDIRACVRQWLESDETFSLTEIEGRSRHLKQLLSLANKPLAAWPTTATVVVRGIHAYVRPRGSRPLHFLIGSRHE